jgi:hypothetical protein
MVIDRRLVQCGIGTNFQPWGRSKQTRLNMKSNVKVLTAAVGAAALAISVLSSIAPASAQVRGYSRPQYTVPQSSGSGQAYGSEDARDPHNDR